MSGVRPTNAADLPALANAVDETGLFPSEYLPGMVAGYLDDPPSGEVWLTVLDGDAPVGFCFAAPEEMAEGVWNMRAIAVAPAHQAKGLGGQLTAALEHALRARNGRLLIADTSGLAAFDATRAFYRNRGYQEEARIGDFWAPGDDKVTFSKTL